MLHLGSRVYRWVFQTRKYSEIPRGRRYSSTTWDSSPHTLLKIHGNTPLRTQNSGRYEAGVIQRILIVPFNR